MPARCRPRISALTTVPRCSLLSHPDSESLAKALDAIGKVATDINLDVRKVWCLSCWRAVARRPCSV